jgi:hypothetical protein
MAKTKPYRKDPSPAHTGLKKYERTFLNRKARRRKKQEKTMQHEVYLCTLEHVITKKRTTALLKKVDEDDDWRTADDGSEISYEWNVVEWIPTGLKKYRGGS